MTIYLRDHITGHFLNQDGQWLASSSEGREFTSTNAAVDFARSLPLNADLYYAFANKVNNFQISHEHDVDA